MAGKCSSISTTMAWSGPGCSGVSSLAFCFCGGQEFNYWERDGWPAGLYRETGCAGTPYLVFETPQACRDFGWRSTNINC
ncbi:hypothetical protein BS78_06G198000 [Paspalum vaginatum]|nr:hypothetical protein BS78_06G198000 [Paspalum vaginatum]